MRDRNNQFTNAAKEQARARARYQHVARQFYAQGARLNGTAFQASGLDMLNMLKPHRVVGRPIQAQGDGRQMGLAVGQVALWAGVDLSMCVEF
jgi:hypothetical protein